MAKQAQNMIMFIVKRILLLIDETQIDKLPFDVADTQVETYNLTNLKGKINQKINIDY